MRGVSHAVIVLLVLAAGAAGLLWLWPADVGSQLIYTVQFPGGFSGDRGAVARQTADILSKKLALLSVSSGATAYPDGRVLIRARNVDPDRIQELRSALEGPGKFGVVADGEALHVHLVRLLNETLSSHLSVTVSPESARRFDRSASRILFFDAEQVAQPNFSVSEDSKLSMRLTMKYPENRDWSIAFESGPLPFPLGAPQVERYRGRSMRP